ncbi:MAG: 50S ribosomal protein L29 [Kiritimatiellae bacterium]|nr:50S ribosomal protein L29 [Kiritimatiellia bacterium]MBP5225895.1 50S ribosomal protein L29 [Kiritimatiellia bacterium]
MKARDLRALGIEGLDQKIKEVSQELMTLKIRHRSGADVEKPGRIKLMRREVARMKTVRTELERGIR